MKKMLFLGMMMIAGLALAQDKVGYVNMNTVFEEYYKTINANVIFEGKKQSFEDKMSLLRSELESLTKELKAVEADAKNELVSEAVREEALRKYRTRAEFFEQKRQAFLRMRQQEAQEIAQLQQETTESLAKELTECVKKFAKDNGYTHIWDVSGQSMNRLPLLMVYPERQEITKALVKLTNAGHEAEIKAAKAKLENAKKANAEKANAAKAGEQTK